jgi:mannose-1-phosphate guanylyltransferase/mannose-6-phosphate isomerase
MNQSKLNEANIVLEPSAKNTMWAISLWIEWWNDDDIFLVLSSDHIIKEEDVFAKIVTNSIESAKESIITFWIKPTKAHTWYGYINFEKKWEAPYKVLNFKEKPDIQTAKEYIEKWYYWNAWIFMFSKWVFMKELEKHNKEYTEIIKTWVLNNFDKLPDLSIDYWLLEKSDNIKISPLDIYWNDLGWFDSFDEYFSEHDIKTDFSEIDWENNLVIESNNNKEVAFIWVSDLIVIDTPDALLISKKWETQKVKNIIEILKSKWKTHTDFWTTVFRPWGSYTIVDEGIWFKTKRLTVLPGKKLSSQMHHHRSEHWVVVSGIAKIRLDDNDMLLSKWQSTYIPIWTKHRLENVWKVDLHIIESQIWDYLEEDDIVRFDDEYGRI